MLCGQLQCLDKRDKPDRIDFGKNYTRITLDSGQECRCEPPAASSTLSSFPFSGHERQARARGLRRLGTKQVDGKARKFLRAPSLPIPPRAPSLNRGGATGDEADPLGGEMAIPQGGVVQNSVPVRSGEVDKHPQCTKPEGHCWVRFPWPAVVGRFFNRGGNSNGLSSSLSPPTRPHHQLIGVLATCNAPACYTSNKTVR